MKAGLDFIFSVGWWGLGGGGGGGTNPFWKCDIWHNRILSAGRPQALHTGKEDRTG